MVKVTLEIKEHTSILLPPTLAPCSSLCSRPCDVPAGQSQYIGQHWVCDVHRAWALEFVKLSLLLLLKQEFFQ